MKYTRFRDIPKFTREAGYQVHQSWEYLEDWLEDLADKESNSKLGMTLDLDPDFQRGHVWTEHQQIRYVEFVLRGGRSSREIFFNHPNWMGSYKGEMVLVDGKQRLQAVRRFMRGEIPAFETLINDYEDRLLTADCCFVVSINNLKSKKEVLQWYIDLNSGGVAHTEEEIEKVRVMMASL